MNEKQSAIRFETHGSVASITLARPTVHNAFDDALIAELTAALQAADADASVRAVVLTGEGATFSAGASASAPSRCIRRPMPTRSMRGWPTRRGRSADRGRRTAICVVT